MTTPAKNLNAVYSGTRITINKPLVGPPVETHTQIVSAREKALRPESKNNIRRPDGSRPASSWSASYGVGRSPRTEVMLINPKGGSTHYSGTVFPVPLIRHYTALPLQEMRSLAIRDALGHFGEAHEKLGVALRELKGTVLLAAQYYRQASNVLERTYEAAGRYKGFRRAMRSYKHGWKEAPSRYLEYSYAIRPIQEDLVAASEVLNELKFSGFAMRMTLKGRYRCTDDLDEPVQSPSGQFSARLRGSIDTNSKCSLMFTLPSWYWDTLPPVTALSEQWATTSYSYIIDWALPISSWLRGFQGTQLRPFFTQGSTTVFTRLSSSHLELVNKGNYGLYPRQVDMPYRSAQVIRDVFDRFPTEAVMRLPRFRSVLQLSHLDDAAALAGQKLAKLSRLLR